MCISDQTINLVYHCVLNATKLKVEKNMYENLLHNNLFKRRDQLLSNIDELGMSERKQDYDSKKAEFAQATEGMEATKKR